MIHRISFLITLLAVTVATACAEREAPQARSGTTEEGLSPNSPNLIYAEGWTELTLDANSATTKIDTVGHFTTDHNMCQRRGDGVFEVEAWNQLATLLNKAVTLAPMTTPRCWDSPDGSRFYNRGNAEITLLRTGKRQIFEYKNREICTTIPDAALSNEIIALIERTINLADRADALDCPNYRP